MTVPQSPYPGLRPFDRDEADIFFGREEQIEALLDQLSRHRFLAVVGVSGCGKSSLVKAGLLPVLADVDAEEDGGWHIAEMRPGHRPMATLARALLASGVLGDAWHAGRNADEFLAAALRRGPLGLADVLTDAGAPGHGRLLILVDQFEEVFRYHRMGDPESAAAFVDLLLTSAAAPGNPVYVMLTMRSDFIGDCALFPGLPEALNRSQFLTPRLSREQRRAAVAGPAAVFGGTVEPRLVNRILNDMGDDPDQLPLMQHALMRVWHQATTPQTDGHNAEAPDGPLLTLAHYDAVGGFGKALSHHANEAYAELEPAAQAIAVRLFRSLCDKGPGDLPVRRPVQLQEVADVAAAPIRDAAGVVEVFRRPGRSFLTPRADVPLTPDTVLDISHESLIRHWDRMKEWYRDELRAAADYRRLLESARRWQAGEADPLGQRDLDHALDWRRREKPTPAWAGRYGGGLTEALTYLKKSVRHRKLKRFRWIATVAVMGVLGVLTLWYQTVSKTSKRAHQYSEAVRLAVQADQARSDYARRAIILAYEAVMKSELTGRRVPIAEQALRDAVGSWAGADSRVLSGHADRINALAYSPDGRLLASGSEDGSVRLWDAGTGLLLSILAGHTAGVTMLTFNPDGSSLASAARDNTVRLWDAATGKSPAPPISMEGPVTDLAYSPDGRVLGTVVRAGAKDYGRNVVYQQSAKMLGYPSEEDGGSVEQLWNAQTGRLIAGPIRHSSDFTAIAPGDGEGRLTLAWLNPEGSAWMVKTLQGDTKRLALNPGDGIAALALSPNGRRLAAGDVDGAVSLWDTASGTRLPPIAGRGTAIAKLIYSADARHLAVVYADGSAGVWDANTGESSIPLLAPESGIGGLVFAPDAQIIATFGPWDKNVILWRTGDGERLSTLTGHTRDVIAVAFSPDGNFLASGGMDNTIRQWDLNQRWFKKTPVVLDHYDAPIISAQMSPGRTRELIVVSRTGLYRETGDPEKAVRPSESRPAAQLSTHRLDDPCDEISLTAASPDGDQTAMICKVPNRELTRAIYEENVPFVWDPAGSALPAAVVLPGMKEIGAAVTALALDAEGRWLYLGDRAGGLRRWDLRSPQDPELLTAPAAPSPERAKGAIYDEESKTAVTAIAVDREGRRMLVGTEQGALVLWHLDGAGPPAPAASLQSRGTAITAALFSRDGLRWLAADRAGVIRAWKEDDPSAEPEVLKGHSSAVNALGVSDDGRWLLSGGDDATARLWDLADPEETSYTAIVLRGHSGSVTTVGFDPGGRWFITGGNDRTVRLWTRRLDELKQKAVAAAGRNLTHDEWKQYFRGEECRKTFEAFPSGCEE